MATTNQMLEALGYGTGSTEIGRFQREHNARGPKSRLLVSGQLDDATREALALDFESRELLAILGRKGGR
jgi:hypothetical protein